MLYIFILFNPLKVKWALVRKANKIFLPLKKKKFFDNKYKEKKIWSYSFYT